MTVYKNIILKVKKFYKNNIVIFCHHFVIESLTQRE